MSDRPKSLRVSTELAPTAQAAATIGNAVQGILGDKAGYILIVIDATGASLATSEGPEEAGNVMSHFVRNDDLLRNGYRIQECACSACQSFRRSKHLV